MNSFYFSHCLLLDFLETDRYNVSLVSEAIDMHRKDLNGIEVLEFKALPK